MKRVVILGGGLFGLTAAIELRRRDWEVVIVDIAGVPREDGSASFDISKAVRADYGTDLGMVAWMETALQRWREWNDEARTTLYHETGIIFATSGTLDDPGFEGDCYRTLTARGHDLQRLDVDGLSEFLPDWRHGHYRDGYFNPSAGWADAAATMRWLAQQARDAGIEIIEHCGSAALEWKGTTVVLGDGTRLDAHHVIVATGAWSPNTLDALGQVVRPTGQLVLYVEVDDPADYQTRPCPWGGDIATTGWFGFPAVDRIVKIANHGSGVPGVPWQDRVVPPDELARFQSFWDGCFPTLAGATIREAKICFYTDTPDGDFLIARHPTRRDVTLATGGSGHAFKFAPVLGETIANVTMNLPDPLASRFAWRTPRRGASEAARATS